MKKLLIIALFIGFASQYSYSQKLIDNKKVPEVVIKRFDKSYRNAKEPKWFIMELEHDYLVKFLDNTMEVEALFNKDGKELSSKTQLPLSKLNSKISEDIRKNHRDKKVDKAYLIVKGRREKYYSVILLKSQGRKKEPLVYEAQYNFNGSYLTLYEPDIKHEPVKENIDEKFQKTLDEDKGELKGGYADEKISKSDLPSPAINYLEENFDIEYRYKEIYAKQNEEYGNYYYVVLKKQGDKKKYVHYFDMYGKLIKVDEVEL